MNNNSVNNLFLNQKVVSTATNYTALANDVIINVNTSATRTITLPAPSANNTGKFYIIKDVTGLAATNNITINAGGANIDGSASTSIQTNYGALQVVSNGTNYYSEGLWVNPSAINPGVWFSYTPTFAGLVIGGGSVGAYYLQVGKTLLLSCYIAGGSGSSGGSGVYTISIPPGFTVNTAIAPVSITASQRFTAIGYSMAGQGAGVVTSGIATLYTASSYAIFLNSASQYWSGTYFGFGTTSYISVSGSIPIL